MPQRTTIISTAVLLGVLFVLFSYSYISAQTTGWTPAPASPPTGNTNAPINVGSSEQIKQGPLGASITFATNHMRSPRYCDQNGENCVVLNGNTSFIKADRIGWSVLERESGPGQFGGYPARGMIHVSSISQRCRELGYSFGVPLVVFGESSITDSFQGGISVPERNRWCHYRNAQTDFYTAGRWWRTGCMSNQNVHTALCIR